MWKYLQVNGEPKLSRDPLLLVSVSTSNPQFQMLYSQAKELANFLLKKKENFKLFASLYSSSLPAMIDILSNGASQLPSCNFYHYSGGERDVVLFAGYSSPVGDEYEFVDTVLSYAKKLGVKELISVGARWAENPISPLETPKVLGFSSDPDGVEWLKNNGVTILADETAFYFSNVIVALAPRYGMRGTKISVNHGEPRPHPKSLIAMLNVLSKKMGFVVDTSELETDAKELADVIGRGGTGEAMEGEVQKTGSEKNIYR